MKQSFDSFISNFNAMVSSIRENNKLITNGDISKVLESQLVVAESEHKEEYDDILNKKRVNSIFLEIKKMCQSGGKIEYKMDERIISIKRPNSGWKNYRILGLSDILRIYFEIKEDDRYYNFIAVHLSQEEFFVLLQIYHHLYSRDIRYH